MAKKPPIHITTPNVDALPFAESAAHPVIYWDDRLRGFGVKVGLRTKTYVAETKVKGNTVRVKVAVHPAKSAEEARKLARVALGEMHADQNPNAKHRRDKTSSMSFRSVCLDYLNNKELTPLTRRDYLKHMDKTLAEWSEVPFLEVTREMVVETYRKIANKTIVNARGEERLASGAQANQAMRFARAVFTFSKRFRGTDRMPLLRDNPVDVLSENRLWRRVRKRTNYIDPSQLPQFWEALWALRNSPMSSDRETIRDFLLLMLFTGLRPGEARDLRWADVDVKARKLTIPDPKNHEEHVLPLSNYLANFFVRRRQATEGSEWVFPASRKQGVAPIKEFRKTIRLVCDMAGVTFTPHDLRRSFLTYTKDLPAKYGPYFSKRLANHKINDITADYIQIPMSDLRKCMEDITSYILDHSKARITKIGMPTPPAAPPPPVRRMRIKAADRVTVVRTD